MAASMISYSATFSSSVFVCQGRSGYNSKPDGDEEDTINKGRSGYNKGDKDDEEE